MNMMISWRQVCFLAGCLRRLTSFIVVGFGQWSCFWTPYRCFSFCFYMFDICEHRKTHACVYNMSCWKQFVFAGVWSFAMFLNINYACSCRACLQGEHAHHTNDRFLKHFCCSWTSSLKCLYSCDVKHHIFACFRFFCVFEHRINVWCFLFVDVFEHRHLHVCVCATFKFLFFCGLFRLFRCFERH